MPEIATPPAAPATPPVAPTAPETPSTPTVPESGAQDSFDAKFADIDSPATPAAPAAKPAASTPAKPAQLKPGTPAPAKPSAKPETPSEFEEAEGVQVPKFKSDKEFRGWALNGYKKATQLEKELNEIKGKHAELEQRVPKTEAERQQLAQKLEAMEKAIAEKEQVIQFTNYEQSQEYKTKFVSPVESALAAAGADIRELTVTEPDPNGQPDENGNKPTRERPATNADFEELYQLPLGAATKLANQKFGAASAIVLQHRNQIRAAETARLNALKTWKDTSKQREEQEKTQSTQQRAHIENMWRKVNEDLATKHADQFAPDPEDKEGNAKLEEGFRMADAFFAERDKRTLDQNIIFDAQVRNRLANYPRLLHKARRLETELAQANKDLAELRGSAPGAPGSGNGAPPATEESEGAMAEFDKKL